MALDQHLRDQMREASAVVGAVQPDRDLVTVKRRGRARLRRRRQVGMGAAAVTLVAAGALVVRFDDDRADQDLTTAASTVDGAGPLPSTAGGPGTTVPRPSPGSWQPISASPLSARFDAATVWTGSEALIVGGVDEVAVVGDPDCGDCRQPTRRTDAAAYSPASDTWRTVASPPVPVAAEAFVDADRVHFLAAEPSDSGTIVTYQPSSDSWSTTSFTGTDPRRTTLAGVFDGRLVLQEHRTTAATAVPLGDAGETDSRFVLVDPSGGAAEELPTPPLPPVQSTRALATADELYLFGLDHADDASFRGAVYRRDAGWRRLPDAPAPRGRNRLLLVDGLLVDAAPGAAKDPTDGSAAWSPYGGVLDVSAGTWEDLPPDRTGGQPFLDLPVAGDGRIFTTDGLLLDVLGRSWTTVPVPAGQPSGPTAVWAGDRLFVWGGAAGDGTSPVATGATFVLDR